MINTEIAGMMFVVLSLILFLVYAVRHLRYKIIRQRIIMHRNNTRNRKIGWITGIFLNNRWTGRIMNEICNKILVYSGYPPEKCLKISTIIMLILAVVVVITFLGLVLWTGTVWYILAEYMLLSFAVTSVILIALKMIYTARFMKHLPQTYKIINSRYINTGNILKAISISLEYNDFNGVISGIMRVIRDVLIKNNMNEIEETFKTIEDNYRNEYLTLLLNLIKQAHYKGGEVMIRKQFEQATEEVLYEIENTKDLSSTSRMYIMLALVLPAGIAGIEKFNLSALGGRALEFYDSPAGLEIKMAILGSLIVFIGLMFFLERSGL